MAELDNKIYAWTPMIRMSDMKYPVYLSDFRLEHKNVSMGDWVWEESMGTDFQYFVVRDSEVPGGDVVTEGAPEKGEDGRWYKTWTSRDFTEEEVAQNLSWAKEDHRSRAYQQFSTDLQAGVVVDGDLIAVDPREMVNLDSIRAYAAANPGSQNILIRKADYTVMEFDSAGAVSKVNDIFVKTGDVQQRLLRYLKSVYESNLITDIPEVPQTFTGE